MCGCGVGEEWVGSCGGHSSGHTHTHTHTHTRARAYAHTRTHAEIRTSTHTRARRTHTNLLPAHADLPLSRAPREVHRVPWPFNRARVVVRRHRELAHGDQERGYMRWVGRCPDDAAPFPRAFCLTRQCSSSFLRRGERLQSRSESPSPRSRHRAGSTRERVGHRLVHAPGLSATPSSMVNVYQPAGTVLSILLFCCSCAYLRRNPSLRALIDRQTKGAPGIVYKAAVIGMRLPWLMSAGCLAMAAYLTFFS